MNAAGENVATARKVMRSRLRPSWDSKAVGPPIPASCAAAGISHRGAWAGSVRAGGRVSPGSIHGEVDIARAQGKLIRQARVIDLKHQDIRS